MATNSKLDFHEGFDTAFGKELAYVKERWEKKETRRERSGAFDAQRLRGLALSGGGIRSAAFCMGVVQQLHVARAIDRLHYMSTVSGGGYLGASLSWFLSRPADERKRRFGTEHANFPFCGGQPAGIRNAGEEVDSKMAGPIDGRAVLDYIRQRSSYLNPGAGFTTVSAVAIVLRSIATSLIAFILLVAAAFVPLLYFRLFDRPVADFGLRLPAVTAPVTDLSWFTALAILLLAMLGMSVVSYSLLTAIPLAGEWAYALRRSYQRWAGTVLALALALSGLGLLNSFIEYLATTRIALPGDDLLSFGGICAAAGAVGGILVRSATMPTNIVTRLTLALLPTVSLFLLLLGVGVLAHRIAAFAIGIPFGMVLLAGVALVFGLYTNINLTGLHRFYRDRLMETFMPDPESIPEDGQAAKTSADDMNLADICGPDDDGPYHLINANIVLLGAKKARQRSRGGDSFLLSRLYCGSEATGFIGTDDWLPGPASVAIGRRHGPLALPTAMAISGAALNPRAGGDGQGLTKGPIVSALLNLLNLRLGYWVPSPRKAQDGGLQPAYRSPPNFIFPGLIQGLFGFRHNQEANWIELTDGGHFENTGIYELVRRRVSTIIFADGSTDPDISLSSFANALEKIYIDFGVTVTFGTDAGFISLLKGTDPNPDSLAQRLQFSKAGYAVGLIHYPSVGGRRSRTGLLFYIKSTMIRDLPTALYSYKATNPLFPAESLADQFFSEQQFEAYRALGFTLAKSMMGAVEKTQNWAEALDIPFVNPNPQAGP